MAHLGRLNKWVTLANKQEESDEDFTPLEPEGAWAAITPQLVVGDASRSVQHIVRMRWHPQVSLDTRITYRADATRRQDLYVRGFQNVEMDDDMVQLYCEEVIP